MQIWELSRRWKAASGVVRYPPRCDSDRDNKKTAGVVGGGGGRVWNLGFRFRCLV